MSDDTKRTMLRHTLATLAYRGGKAIRDAPPEFATLSLGETTRTPLEVLAHVGDLLVWGCRLADGDHTWEEPARLDWDGECARFFEGLARFDARLASDEPLGSSEERLFQGPVADALQHVGQITMMRRLGGAPIRGENYYRAEIAAGRVGPEQEAPRREFD